MVSRELEMFAILSVSIATAISGTPDIGLAASVFTGGEHHDQDENCKIIEDNNCNDKHKTQKNKAQ